MQKNTIGSSTHSPTHSSIVPTDSAAANLGSTNTAPYASTVTSHSKGKATDTKIAAIANAQHANAHRHGKGGGGHTSARPVGKTQHDHASAAALSAAASPATIPDAAKAQAATVTGRQERGGGGTNGGTPVYVQPTAIQPSLPPGSRHAPSTGHPSIPQSRDTRGTTNYIAHVTTKLS